MSNSNDIIHRDIALPRELDDRLAALAADMERGSNEMIVSFLERVVREYESAVAFKALT
jgi:predicted DNA-binding protein